MISLDLVIVTFNRLDKLKKTLRCYECQTRMFRNLIVVNNCSSDGTKMYLDEWSKRSFSKFNPIIINTKENIGGSGGFYIGQKKAMEQMADWVFVADDDAYAMPNMVEEFYNFIETHDTVKIAAVCSEVLNMDGSICLYHRSRYTLCDSEGNGFTDKVSKTFVRTHSTEVDYTKKFFNVDFFSYVGTFLNCRALKKCGLVNPDYFIYYDDSEHSLRLSKYGNLVVVPSIKITHEGGNETSTNNSSLVSWREYYFKRNRTNMLIRHLPRTVIQEYWFELHEYIRLKRNHEIVSLKKQIQWTALFDALFNRLGKHKIYKPGWQIMKNETK